MQRNTITLGRVFGVPIRIHTSWFLAVVLIAWSLASQYFPTRYAWGQGDYWLVAVATTLLLFVSVLFHELSHSLAAMWHGLPVHDIVLFIFGGVAELTEEPERPRVEFGMAIAGPMASFFLAFAFIATWFLTRESSERLAALCLYLAGTNASLGAFNLIPGFPLDGGRVLRAVLWAGSNNLQKATRWATTAGQVVAYLFIGIGVLRVIQRSWIDGIWLAMIGWWLENAAQTSYRRIAIQQFLQDHWVREAMRGQCFPVAPNITVDVLVRDHILPLGFRCFPVVQDGRMLGLVSFPAVRKVPESDWPQVTVRAVMYALDRFQSLSPDDDLWKAMEAMVAEQQDQLPVVQDGEFVGVLNHDDILAYLRANSRLRV